MLVVTLVKGKGPIASKLQTIKLTKGDLQKLIRIFIRGRNNKNLERNERLSKFNHGSWCHHSAEMPIAKDRVNGTRYCRSIA